MVQIDTVEIFFSIVCGLLLLLVLLFVVFRKRKRIRVRVILAFCSLIVVSFCWGWFIPVRIGQKGESSICKFRFQVYIYDTHAYNGDGEVSDWLFLYYYDNSYSKYGSMAFYKRLGGAEAYFGLKEIE